MQEKKATQLKFGSNKKVPILTKSKTRLQWLLVNSGNKKEALKSVKEILMCDDP